MPEMIAGSRAYIEAPPVTPLGGGVLAAAHVIPTSGHELMGAQFLSDACAELGEWVEWCDMTPTGRKVFDGTYGLIEGDPFVVYAGTDCVSETLSESQARAVTRLDLLEGRSVDANVLALAEAEAIDLGGPFPISQAIGVAEAFMATVYGGRPTLLIPRRLVPCACGDRALSMNLDGSLTTCQGSLVANVTTAITAPVTADLDTIYITGQITLLQGPVTAISVPTQVLDAGTFAPARALAERVYVPLLDCVVAKVEASCS